jgi:hypothetical protein
MADKEYSNRSCKVFNIGTANYLPAYSSEIGVPVRGDNHVRAIEGVFALAQRHRERGIYQTSPIALRFVRRSPAYLSMMHAADTMMVGCGCATRSIPRARSTARSRSASGSPGGASRRSEALGQAAVSRCGSFQPGRGKWQV